MFQSSAFLFLAQVPATTPAPTPVLVGPGDTPPGGAFPAAPAPTPAAVVTAATTSQPGAATQGDAPVKPSPMSQFLGTVGPIILMIAVLYFVLFRGPKKEEKKRKAMLSEMKKGDTVMTIGGLIARVVSIDGDNIVLKIDESANVKATYTKRSIQQVLSDDDKAK